MQIEQHEDRENSEVTSSKDQHHSPHLTVFHQAFNFTVRQLYFVMSAHHSVNERGEQKLQRVHVKQHHKQERGIQYDRRHVLEPIAPEKLVLIEPNDEEQNKTDRKRAKAAHRMSQLAEGLRHFKGNYQQGDGERKNSVAETFNSRDLMAAPAKFPVLPNVVLK